MLFLGYPTTPRLFCTAKSSNPSSTALINQTPIECKQGRIRNVEALVVLILFDMADTMHKRVLKGTHTVFMKTFLKNQGSYNSVYMKIIPNNNSFLYFLFPQCNCDMTICHLRIINIIY